MQNRHLNKPIVGMAGTPDGKGYWLVASDGGIFTFGDASFYGSMGGHSLNSQVAAMIPSPDGAGYGLVMSNSDLFDFGDAITLGLPGPYELSSPVVGAARP